MITYMALNDQAPRYLTELLHQKANTRTLKSSGELILVAPKYKLQTYGLNVFSAAAPTLWNKLPRHIRNSKSLNVFKNMLKHFVKHLFSFIVQNLRTGLPRSGALYIYIIIVVVVYC